MATQETVDSMSPEDVEKLQAYFKANNYPNVDYFLASHQRLLQFCQSAYTDLEMLRGAGDLE